MRPLSSIRSSLPTQSRNALAIDFQLGGDGQQPHMAGMVKFTFLLTVAGLLAASSALTDARAQTDRRSLIYDLLEQRQSRDPSLPDTIERLPDRPALPDTLRTPDSQRDPILRPGAPDPTAPRSPLLESDRRQQEQREFQERLDRRERFERQRLLMER